MDYDFADVQKRVVTIAAKASALKPKTVEEVGLFGTFMGVLFALDRAAALEYDGERLKDAAGMKDEFLAVARALSSDGSRLPQAWEAGFYVTDFVFRLEALGTRMQDYHPDNKNYFIPPAPFSMFSMSKGATLKKKVPKVQVGGHHKWKVDLQSGTQAAEYLVDQLAELFVLSEHRRTPLP